MWNKWKIKWSLEKLSVFFGLNSFFLMFDVCQMVLWLIIPLLDGFASQKINERYKFLSLKGNVQSIQSVLLLFTCYTEQTRNRFLFLSLNSLLKLLEKWAVQITLSNIPLFVSKIMLNICEIPYIDDSFSSFISVYQNL